MSFLLVTNFVSNYLLKLSTIKDNKDNKNKDNKMFMDTD